MSTSGNERMAWWKVAMHLDEAQHALSNAMAHNVDDPQLMHTLYSRLREGQAILLEIFRAKDLLPAAPNGTIEVPTRPAAGISATSEMLPAVPVPAEASGEAAVAAPPVVSSIVEQPPPLVADEPAVPEVDQAAAASAPEEPAVPASERAVSAAITAEAPKVTPSPEPASPMVTPPPDPSVGSAGG